MHKELPLTRGLVALVDEEDFASVGQYKWYASHSNRGKMYAARRIRDGASSRIVYLHRILMGADRGTEIDHVNADSLDNRRANLRVATRKQQMRNAKLKRDNTSGFKGVYRSRGSMWTVQITDDGRMRTVTGIGDVEVAAAIYDLLAYDRFGEFARFNNPEFMRLWIDRKRRK